MQKRRQIRKIDTKTVYKFEFKFSHNLFALMYCLVPLKCIIVLVLPLIWSHKPFNIV
jgi:hypothetical protein